MRPSLTDGMQMALRCSATPMQNVTREAMNPKIAPPTKSDVLAMFVVLGYHLDHLTTARPMLHELRMLCMVSHSILALCCIATFAWGGALWS